MGLGYHISPVRSAGQEGSLGRPTPRRGSGLYEFLGEDLHLVKPTSLFMEGG